MSLHHIAEHLASRGRNGDSVLVHMTPEEVHGLQALALAHGGSLTINPDTGLPEASFLKKLLPMISGALLTFFSGGALSPLAAGMITGAGTGLITGDWKRGLMAGFGAYGGAGIGNALAKAGANATGNVVLNEAQKAAAAQAQNAALTGTGPASGLFNNVTSQSLTAAANPAAASGTGVTSGMFNNALKGMHIDGAAATAAPTTSGITAGFGSGTTAKDLINAGVSKGLGDTGAKYSLTALNEGLGNAGSGIQAAWDSPAVREQLVKDIGKKYALGALAPFTVPDKQKEKAPDKPEYYVTRYHPGEVNQNWGQPGNTQPYFIGQRYDTGITTKDDPYTAMQNLAAGSPATTDAPSGPLQYFSNEGVRPFYAGASGGQIPAEEDMDGATYADGGSTSLQDYMQRVNSMGTGGSGYTLPPPKQYIDTTPYEGVSGGSADIGSNMSGYTPELPSMAYGTMPEYVHGSNTTPPWTALGEALSNVGHSTADSFSKNASAVNDFMHHPVASTMSGLGALARGASNTFLHPVNTAQRGLAGLSGYLSNLMHKQQQPINRDKFVTDAARLIRHSNNVNGNTVNYGGPTVTPGPGGGTLSGSPGGMASSGAAFGPWTPQYQNIPDGSVLFGGFVGDPYQNDGTQQSKAAGGMLGDGYAAGGETESLGHYSDGGRLLRGPGDGVSDDIPARIHRDDGTQHEARLADGEFVFPARIVSEIGNGSTEAGAQKLYAIMDRIQRDRARSIKDVAVDTNAERHFANIA